MANSPKFLPRLVSRDGRSISSSVVRIGLARTAWGDLYHLLLTMSWTSFLGLLCVLYLVTNAVFALAYLLGGDCLQNAESGSFADAFFFSVQTMATIGYGAIAPRTLYANLIVSIEALVGLLGVAMATGLMFSRFARPTSRVMFSKVAVIAPHNSVPTLMFRTANERQNQILEARLRVALVRNEITEEGILIRRFHDLNLLRHQSPIFALTWMAMHPIDETSPLYGCSYETLAEQEVEIVVTLTGTDETFAQTVHARQSYILSEIIWNARFVDILSKLPDGRRRVNYKHFHDVIPLSRN